MRGRSKRSSSTSGGVVLMQWQRNQVMDERRNGKCSLKVISNTLADYMTERCCFSMLLLAIESK